jgi:hypothetical protein
MRVSSSHPVVSSVIGDRVIVTEMQWHCGPVVIYGDESTPPATRKLSPHGHSGLESGGIDRLRRSIRFRIVQSHPEYQK